MRFFLFLIFIFFIFVFRFFLIIILTPGPETRFLLILRLFHLNLFYFIKHTPGTTPDGAHTESSLMATALDLCPYPATRNFGVAINIGF